MGRRTSFSLIMIFFLSDINYALDTSCALFLTLKTCLRFSFISLFSKISVSHFFEFYLFLAALYFILNRFYLFIYLIIFVAACGFLAARASPAGERGLQGSKAQALDVAHRLSCSTACGFLVPRLGIKPTSLAPASRLSTTGLIRKSQASAFKWVWKGTKDIWAQYTYVYYT